VAKVPDIVALCPRVKVIALIHHEEDRRPAEAAGTDSVLSVGMRATRLREVIMETAYSDRDE
jgi:hypothetical protein